MLCIILCNTKYLKFVIVFIIIIIIYNNNNLLSFIL